MNYAIETTNLCKEYKKELKVNHLNLHIPTECIYGFLGPNGAGKSTTMKMMLGLIKPTAGSVKVFDQPFQENMRISILSQTGSLIESPAFYGHLSGQENLEIIAELKGVSHKEIEHVLKIVHLADAGKKKARHYSLGMKQRLGIAGALLGNPKLILLDEPTNGLDPAGIQEIRELICTLPKEYGMTVFLSSHLLSEIDQMADFIGIIDHGLLLFEDSLDALHARGSANLLLKTTDTTKSISILNQRRIPNAITTTEFHQSVIVIPLLSDSELIPLLQTLWDNHIQILRIEEKRKSLEDIFLDITGRNICLS